MSEVVLTNHRWNETIRVPSSKSLAHRAIVCAALSETPLENLRIYGGLSEDLRSTFEAVKKLSCGGEVDFGESGSTMRFLLPVFAALGRSVRLTGSARLSERPIGPLLAELRRHGVIVSGDGLPLEMRGRMSGGDFNLPGNVSSQFVTGLLLALPLTGQGGVVRISAPLESRPYVDLTVQMLSEFGVQVEVGADYWRIPAEARYHRLPGMLEVEGDWSAAAFPLVAAAIGGWPVAVAGLNWNSLQGDRRIAEIIPGVCTQGAMQCPSDESLGAMGSCVISPAPLRALGEIDVRDIPDLVPAMAVLAGVSDGITRFTHCGRLRLKESDRLEAIRAMLVALGGKAVVCGETLEITGVERYAGGTVDGCYDHRIVMAAATAACASTAPVRILGSEAVSKSWPSFWKDTGANSQ